MFVQMFVQNLAGLPGYDYCSKKSPKKPKKARKSPKKSRKAYKQGLSGYQ